MHDRYGDASDSELVQLTREGDERAFGVLWQRYWGAAQSVARIFGADAEEVVADSFSAVLRAIRHGKGPTDNFRAYLFASVRNCAIRFVNAQRRHWPLNCEEDAAHLKLTSTPHRDPVADTYVREVFQSLPERWRTVLWYLEIEQFSLLETSEVMGIAPNAVSALALRARRGLRKSWIRGHRATVPSGSGCRTTIDHLESRLLGLDPVDYDAGHVRDCSFCEAILAEPAWRSLASHPSDRSRSLV